MFPLVMPGLVKSTKKVLNPWLFFFVRCSLHIGTIGSGTRLCESTAANSFPLSQWNQVFFFLRLRPPLQQHQTAQTGMHGEHNTQSRIDRFEFLTSQPERNIIQPLTAVFHRNAHAQNPQFSHPWQCERRHFLFSVLFTDRRGNFFLCKITYHHLHHELFLSQVEVHAVNSSQINT